MYPKSTPTCTRKDAFCGKIAPHEHLLQVYATDDSLLESLEAFVSGGLGLGEAVIVIATASHRHALADRLRARGVNVEAAMASGQLLPYDAEETLNGFILNGWPNKMLFEEAVRQILGRAQMGGRKIRVYGEMVAVLWARGPSGATIWLEQLWNQFMRNASFSLFCAYPKTAFTEGAHPVLNDICREHSRLIED